MPTHRPPDHCCQSPWPHSRPVSTHTSTGDSQSPRQVWLSLPWGHCYFPYDLVHTRLCLCPPKVSISPVYVYTQLIHFIVQHCKTAISWVQTLSCVWLFATPWTAARQASLSIINSQSSPKFIYIESMMPSNHLILCRPLLLPPSIFPSIRVFSNESVICIRWPKYWSFSFSISPSNEYSGLISFRTDSLDFLAVQRILKSLLQHRSSKASTLQCSAFFIVQLSHPYMTTGKTIALTRWTLVGKNTYIPI